MTKSEFTWWLHGWFEIEKPITVDAIQLQEIKNHLNLVFPIFVNINNHLEEENARRKALGLSSLFYC